MRAGSYGRGGQMSAADTRNWPCPGAMQRVLCCSLPNAVHTCADHRPPRCGSVVQRRRDVSYSRLLGLDKEGRGERGNVCGLCRSKGLRRGKQDTALRCRHKAGGGDHGEAQEPCGRSRFRKRRGGAGGLRGEGGRAGHQRQRQSDHDEFARFCQTAGLPRRRRGSRRERRKPWLKAAMGRIRPKSLRRSLLEGLGGLGFLGEGKSEGDFRLSWEGMSVGEGDSLPHT